MSNLKVPPTDEQRADWVQLTRAWRQNATLTRHWELPNLVRRALQELLLDTTDVVAFGALVQRVTHIIRSRRAKKGNKKRRATLLQKKQGNLFY